MGWIKKYKLDMYSRVYVICVKSWEFVSFRMEVI